MNFEIPSNVKTRGGPTRDTSLDCSNTVLKSFVLQTIKTYILYIEAFNFAEAV